VTDSFDRRTLLAALLGTAGVAATAACSGDSPKKAPTPTATTPTPTPSPTATADTRPRWPLTGRLLTNPAQAKHAAVAVKVPDNKNEHPQVGLDQADIVFVELDGYRDSSGYSSTRLVPVFHSQMPDGVEPVRSIRPVDIPLLSPINAIIGNTGATGWVLNYVRHWGRVLEGGLSYMATRGSGSYSIDPSRVRVYRGVTYYDRAVVCHPRVLANQTRKFRTGPPQVYFPYASTPGEVSTTKGKPARTIHVPWKRGHTYDMGYQYSAGSGRYLRSMPWGPHVLRNGTRVAPQNVLVIRTRQHYGKIYPGAGHDEPLHDIIDAHGTFYYFHGGRYVGGTWSKAAVTQLFRFTVSDGSPLKMAPGQTYVELPQINAHVLIKP
jgi:Protein of unknown function (DUF3048) N-terminal domain/Protein of unknown function (DUF3048) C-terminal domain